MAEISLRVYQSKLDDLLGQNKFNEVIAHCRHILTEQPKNLKAYSQMGQALFLASRWDESAELFRRLLGALPNDFAAHSHLGEIYQQLGQVDDAIWHTERSYDQQPNNSEIINLLRMLYKKHRGKDIQRLQLTAGAVAQQHIRNSLYQQAVAVLDKALKRYPNRIDLQVLRIRALWRAERYLDAAESAVNVLAVLPYSMTANRILTDLWLMEQRPSDAQRYLSRIEDLDPYLAYRLATGENAVDSLITIEELDYEAISRHELATENPDWLNTLSNVESQTDDTVEPVDTDDDDMAWLNEIEDNVPVKKVTDDLENLLSDEWQAQVDQLDAEPITDDDLDDLFDSLDDEDGLLAELADSDDDLDDLFGDLEDDNLQLPEGINQDDLPDGLLDRIEHMKDISQNETMPATNRPDIGTHTEAELTGMLNQLDATEKEEDLSWLTDVQQGEYDASDEADDSPPPKIESDWLQELEDIESSPDAQRVSTGLTGMFDDDDEGDIGDLLDDIDESDDLELFGDDDADDLVVDEYTPAEPINPDDPNAWMQSSGIEFSKDVEDQKQPDPFDFEAEGVSIEADDMSPVAWLDESTLTDDTDLASDTDDLFEDDLAADTDDLFEGDLAADTDDLFEDSHDDEPVSETPDLFEDLEDSEIDPTATSDDAWLGDDDMLDEMLSLESEDVDFKLDLEDSADTGDVLAEASVSDRQDTMNDDLNNDWQAEQPDDENDPLAWLSDDDGGTDDDSAGMPQFFDDLDAESESDVPSTESSDSAVDLEDMFAQMSEDDFEGDDSGLEWLEAEELIESADDVELVLDTPVEDDEDDPLGWLNPEETVATGEGETESTGMTDALGDEVDAGDIEEGDDEAEAVAELDASSDEGGHWLDRVGLSPDDDAPSTEAEADWLADIEDDGEFGQADGKEAVEWLAEDVADSFNFEDDDESEELVDLFDFEDDEAPEFDFEAESVAETEDEPDWLSALDTVVDGDDSDDEVAEVVDEQADWLSDVARDEEAEEEVAVENTDDWLSELGEFDEDHADLIAGTSDEAEAEEVDQPDWLGDVAVAGAGVAAAMAASDMLDEDAEGTNDGDGWLTELGEFEGDAEAEAIADEDSSDWIAELGEFEDEEVASMADDLNWMSEDEDEHSAETAVGTTSDVDYLEEVDPATAESALDWMTDADEEDEVIYDDLEEQPQGITDFLKGDDDQDVEAVADDEPDWLTASDDFASETEVEAVADDEPDWLAASDDFEAEVEAVVDDEPDWLTASDDFEAEVDAVPDSGYDYENDDTIVGRPTADDMQTADESDWLTGMDEGDGIQDAFADDSADELDWEDDTSLEEAQTVDDPDWLAGMGIGDSIQDAFAEATPEEAEFVEEVIDGSGVEDELDAITDDEGEPTVIFEDMQLEFEGEEFANEETVPSSGLVDDDYLADFDEEIEHTPAQDAPDWLNAMVPGLDIDYEAEEDEPVDQGFIGEAQTATSDEGFDWLQEIVDEETGPIQAIAPRPQPVTAPRFQFSKPPAWLEKLQGGATTSSVAVATVISDAVSQPDQLDYIDVDEFNVDSKAVMAGDVDSSDATSDDVDSGDSEFTFDDLADMDSMDDDQFILDDLDDFDDEFDTQVGSTNVGDDELPDWLDFDDDD